MKTKKCPVCDWEIKDGGIKVKVGGKDITVCCDECAKKAKEGPAKRSGAGKRESVPPSRRASTGTSLAGSAG